MTLHNRLWWREARSSVRLGMLIGLVVGIFLGAYFGLSAQALGPAPVLLYPSFPNQCVNSPGSRVVEIGVHPKPTGVPSGPVPEPIPLWICFP